jgi:prolyl-tRNA synthetase
VQVVIVPIWRTSEELAVVEHATKRVLAMLKPAVRARVDWRDDRTPGRKFADWELKGVPLRIEIGPRDVAANQIVAVRRDSRTKSTVGLDQLASGVLELLGAIQANLLASARAELAGRTALVDDAATLAERVAANAGWSLVHWCGDAVCEATIKTGTKATIRCIPRHGERESGACLVCGRSSQRRVIVARAY